MTQHDVEPVGLHDLLRRADIVSMHAPATADAFHLLTEEHFRLMKREALFINTGRGSTVDEAALVKALEEGWIAGAGLDVFEQEPLPPDSPFWSTRNLIVTPHVSCDTPGYIDRLLDRWFANFERFLANKPLENAVDPVRGY